MTIILGIVLGVLFLRFYNRQKRYAIDEREFIERVQDGEDFVEAAKHER